MGGGGGGSQKAFTTTQPGQNPTWMPGTPALGITWNSPVGNPNTPDQANQQNQGNWQGWPGSYTFNLPEIKPGGQTYSQPAPPSPGLSQGGGAGGSQNSAMMFNLGQMLGSLLASGGGPFASATQFPGSNPQFPGPPGAGKSL